VWGGTQLAVLQHVAPAHDLVAACVLFGTSWRPALSASFGAALGLRHPITCAWHPGQRVAWSAFVACALLQAAPYPPALSVCACAAAVLGTGRGPRAAWLARAAAAAAALAATALGAGRALSAGAPPLAPGLEACAALAAGVVAAQHTAAALPPRLQLRGDAVRVGLAALASAPLSAVPMAPLDPGVPPGRQSPGATRALALAALAAAAALSLAQHPLLAPGSALRTALAPLALCACTEAVLAVSRAAACPRVPLRHVSAALAMGACACGAVVWRSPVACVAVLAAAGAAGGGRAAGERAPAPATLRRLAAPRGEQLPSGVARSARDAAVVADAWRGMVVFELAGEGGSATAALAAVAKWAESDTRTDWLLLTAKPQSGRAAAAALAAAHVMRVPVIQSRVRRDAMLALENHVLAPERAAAAAAPAPAAPPCPVARLAAFFGRGGDEDDALVRGIFLETMCAGDRLRIGEKVYMLDDGAVRCARSGRTLRRGAIIGLREALVGPTDPAPGCRVASPVATLRSVRGDDLHQMDRRALQAAAALAGGAGGTGVSVCAERAFGSAGQPHPAVSPASSCASTFPPRV